MITVLTLLEAYTKPTRFRKASINRRSEFSVWILPAGTERDGDIDDVLAHDGIRVLERVSEQEAERCVEDIRRKFRAGGLDVKKEFLCND